MTAPAFGLYSAPAMLASQRVAVGTALALDTPVEGEGGGLLFRRSHWLPLPEQLSTLAGLRLAPASELQAHFAPRRFTVPIGDDDWFNDHKLVDGGRVSVGFTWPAPVVAIPASAARRGFTFDLYRADGDKVASEATVTGGRTGRDLSEPWIGSPLVVDITGSFSTDFDLAIQDSPAVGVGLRERAPATRAAPVGAGSGVGSSTTGVQVQTALATLLASELKALTLRGQPTSPRLKLYAEGAGDTPDQLLWQALQAGEQASAVDLPEKPLDEEWAAAFEQLRRLAEPPKTAPARLRLDIESDAPCTVTLTALQLALELELELLAQPQRFDFDGLQPASAPLALTLPAGGNVSALRLSGTVDVEAGADAGGNALPGDARTGALAEPGLALRQPVNLSAPLALAGVALAWQPLSSALKGRVRLLSSAGSMLAEAPLQGDSTGTGWLALRWPALDLQAQMLQLELTLAEGAGVWIFDPASSAASAQMASSGAVNALPKALALRLLPATPDDSPQRAVGISQGNQLLVEALPAGALKWPLPASALPLLRSQPLVFNGGARGSVTVESARLSLRL